MTNGDNDTPFVRVTNREIYDRLGELEETVRSMDGRMNAILNENVETKTRVRALELKVYTILAGLCTTLAGGVILLLKGVLNG